MDRPRINREEVLRQDCIDRQVRQHFDQICALVEEGERLGAPCRKGIRTIVPVAARGA